MKYRLIQVTTFASSRTTTFDGYLAEETADQKFREIEKDIHTQYVILMGQNNDDQTWFVRAERFKA